jgi:response regulator RpfG family c-di-GMP phosphodiesterase
MTNEATLDDDLLFLPEDNLPGADEHVVQPWKVLIADDEAEVHNVTRLVLQGFNFAGRPVDFLSAYSAAEAFEVLQANPDTAVVLLDVVMEQDDAGLQLVRRIRDELGNSLIRIVLRTGQPGQAPEERVIVEYDINDYKAKTELTAAKLFTTMVAALRSYSHLRRLETNKRGLETIVQASGSLFELKALEQFFAGVLTQLTALLNLKDDALYCRTSGFAASCAGGEMRIVAGTGQYSEAVDRDLREAVDDDEVRRDLERARKEGRELYLEDNRYVGYFRAENGVENLLYLQGWNGLSEWDRYLIEVFCTNVAIAHDNISLNNEIIETQREIIWKLGEIVETRSRETGNHVKRVAEYSCMLAEAIGLSHEDCTILRFASPMHDVGKVGISDDILKKPGALTPEEIAVMRTHTTIGYEMLRKSRRQLLQAAAIVALQHHENYDGSGYPNGLAGEDIHIFGRITAVADVFDALGVTRVYKKAWPLDKILDYFHQQRGKQFDPLLTDAFFDNIHRFLEVREAFPDVDEMDGVRD